MKKTNMKIRYSSLLKMDGFDVYKKSEVNIVAPTAHMGTAFFVEEGKNFFSCVHGSKKATGEVMFLAAIAWVKGG